MSVMTEDEIILKMRECIRQHANGTRSKLSQDSSHFHRLALAAREADLLYRMHFDRIYDRVMDPIREDGQEDFEKAQRFVQDELYRVWNYWRQALMKV